MSIGSKAMFYVAECMALGAKELLENPEIIEKAWEEHRKTN